MYISAVAAVMCPIKIIRANSSRRSEIAAERIWHNVRSPHRCLRAIFTQYTPSEADDRYFLSNRFVFIYSTYIIYILYSIPICRNCLALFIVIFVSDLCELFADPSHIILFLLFSRGLCG